MSSGSSGCVLAANTTSNNFAQMLPEDCSAEFGYVYDVNCVYGRAVWRTGFDPKNAASLKLKSAPRFFDEQIYCPPLPPRTYLSHNTLNYLEDIDSGLDENNMMRTTTIVRGKDRPLSSKLAACTKGPKKGGFAGQFRQCLELKMLGCCVNAGSSTVDPALTSPAAVRRRDTTGENVMGRFYVEEEIYDATNSDHIEVEGGKAFNQKEYLKLFTHPLVQNSHVNNEKEILAVDHWKGRGYLFHF